MYLFQTNHWCFRIDCEYIEVILSPSLCFGDDVASVGALREGKVRYESDMTPT
jgi:hypothetical protein